MLNKTKYPATASQWVKDTITNTLFWANKIDAGDIALDQDEKLELYETAIRRIKAIMNGEKDAEIAHTLNKEPKSFEL